MKKVLFVTYDFPYPTNTGGKNRAYHMLKYSGVGFKKYLFSFVRPDFKSENIKHLGAIGVEVLKTVPRRKVTDPRNVMGLLGQGSIFKTLYYSEDILEELIRLIRQYEIDIVHFESFFTGFYISSEIKNLGAKQIYGSENVEYKMYRDYAVGSPFFIKPFMGAQADKIKQEEESMARAADVCVAVSDAEAREISKTGAECEIVRNGVDIDEFKPRKLEKEVKNLLFVGNFTYFPNVDAISFFYNEVFKKLEMDLKLTVIGKKVFDLPFAREDRVEAIEFVKNIQDAYDNADIMVSPVRLGGGTNFKVLEAMAAGVPVIALQDRIVGLDVKDGVNIMVAKDGPDFVRIIDRLAGDHVLRTKISNAARKLVTHEYSWKIIGNNLATIWENL